MTSRDFCFWLQGYLELREEKNLSEAQLDTLKRHLALVFKHEIDPSMGDAKQQASLNKFHIGPPQDGGGGGPVFRC